MKPGKEKILSGARKILSDCLGLQDGDDVLIFCDETTTDVVAVLVKAACHLGIDYAVLYEPVESQAYHDPSEDFPWPVKSIVDKTCAILTCLSDHVEGLPFRKRIIRNGQGVSRRIGHMPGACLLGLAVADADYKQMQRDCENLAVALTKGHHIRLITQDTQGREYVLEAGLGGWNQTPVPSDGVIPMGAWGNIPGGETYIAPLANTANGEIVIKVALPGLPLYNPEGTYRLWKEEAILRFEDGTMVDYRTTSDAVLKVIEHEKSLAEKHGDPNWRNLAEIGLGTNKSVRVATGIPLIDEKMYGTVHIAIGDNTHHGGTNKSVIHCDLVTFATVEIDGKTILAEGELRFKPEEWYEHYTAVRPREVQEPSAYIRYSGDDYQIEGRMLYKILGSGAGRLLKIPVGDPETAKIAAQVIGLLPRDRSFRRVAAIMGSTDLSQEQILPVLQLLCDYHLAEVRMDLPGM